MIKFNTIKLCCGAGLWEFRLFLPLEPWRGSKLLEEVFTQSKTFFNLPLTEKMKVIHGKNHRGYTPFKEEVLDPDVQSKGPPISWTHSSWILQDSYRVFLLISSIIELTVGDCKERYYIGIFVPESDPRSKKRLLGPNQLPSSGTILNPN
jgi:isopenicillin N synthase-like dioxygenase